MATEKVEGKYLYYKNRPLVREGDTLVYGDKNEKYILLLDIISYKEEHGVKVPDGIFIQVVDSKDTSKVIKQGDKKELSEAFNLGCIWLEHALKQ